MEEGNWSDEENAAVFNGNEDADFSSDGSEEDLDFVIETGLLVDVDKYWPSGAPKVADVEDGGKPITGRAKLRMEIAELDKKLNLMTMLTSLVGNDKMADVYFMIPRQNTIGQEAVVGSSGVPGHRMLLSLRSEVFEAMFYGLMSESLEKCPEINLPDIEYGGFMALLKYMYTDKVDINAGNVISAAYAGRKYLVDKFSKECDDFLHHDVSPSNIFIVLNSAIVYGDVENIDLLWSRFDEMALEAVNDDSFLDVSKDLLVQIVSKDQLSIAEGDLFKAVIRWAFKECKKRDIVPEPLNIREVLGTEVLHKIRFPTMPSDEFAFRSGLVDGYLTPEEQSSIFSFFIKEDAKRNERRSMDNFDETSDMDDSNDSFPEKDEPSPRAGCSTQQDSPAKVSPKKLEEPECPFPTVPRKGLIIPTPQSSYTDSEEYSVRRFGQFQHGKTCEFDEFHKVDFTVSIPVTLTGIGVFGTRCDRGQERVAHVELIETSSGTVVASGKLRYMSEQTVKIYHVRFNTPVQIEASKIYTVSSNFDQNYPFHTYHGIHGKRIITIENKVPEPEVLDAPPPPQPPSAASQVIGLNLQFQPTVPYGGLAMDAPPPPWGPPPVPGAGHGAPAPPTLAELEQQVLRLGRNITPRVLRARITSLRSRLNEMEKLAAPGEEVSKTKVFKKVTFTFFKTELYKELDGVVHHYTGDTCGDIGQIPHILFKF